MSQQNFYVHFGSRVKMLRKKRKVTQTELANYLGINQTTLVNYENANRKMPLDLAAQIAVFFNVTIDAIISAHDQESELVKNWNQEFKNIVFRPHETKELINYGKYILFKRNDD